MVSFDQSAQARIDQPNLREAARQAGAFGYVVKNNLLEIVRLLEALGAQNRGST
jgi:hypothetical protein